MRYTVTGGNGFLGRHVVDALRARGHDVFAPTHHECDLMTAEGRERVTADTDALVHLAADVGGIGLNEAHPGRLFYRNTVMGVELMEEARRQGVERFVSVGTACEYPAGAEFLQENRIWDGYPVPVTAAYGMAKKMLLVQGQAYRDEFGFDARHVIPTNLYGPGDHFEPEYGHVIPSIIVKVSHAKRHDEPTVTLWGSGFATRDFLYVTDAADGIVRACEVEYLEGPVNLGTGVETSVRQVAEEIANQYGWPGLFAYDPSRPDGQRRRVMSTEPAKELLDWEAKISLGWGIDHTIEYYEGSR